MTSSLYNIMCNNFCALVLCQTIICCVFMISTCLFLQMYQIYSNICCANYCASYLFLWIHTISKVLSSYLVRNKMYSSKHKFVNMLRHFDLDSVQQTMSQLSNEVIFAAGSWVTPSNAAQIIYATEIPKAFYFRHFIALSLAFSHLTLSHIRDTSLFCTL